jgi:hypothetical protein
MQTTIRRGVADTAGTLRLVRRFWDHGIRHFNSDVHCLDNGRVFLLADLGKWLLGFPVSFPHGLRK